MASEVYFSSVDNKKFISPLNKITRLLEKCNIKDKFKKNDLVALKVHFGEFGNTSFIRPIFLRPVIDSVKALGAKPFLTDTNTLYVGMRTNSVDHLHNAALNGFNYSTLQVPVIIADGIRGENIIEYAVDFPLLKTIKIAADIFNSDGIIAVSHFKAHELSGIGGAVKNLAMGCGGRRGKYDMHSDSKPHVKAKDCTRCGKCVTSCQVKAIEMKDKAFITDRCVGCGRCIAVCPELAINVDWNSTSDGMQKKMVEYSFGIEKAMNKKITYVNIMTQMSPACDCYGGNDKPMAPDVGFLSSDDPVALDRACFDLLLKAAGKDPIKEEYPAINSYTIFDYAKEIGFGSSEYKLVSVE
jgi:uncharacterized Fe-S center protein